MGTWELLGAVGRGQKAAKERGDDSFQMYVGKPAEVQCLKTN